MNFLYWHYSDKEDFELWRKNFSINSSRTFLQFENSSRGRPFHFLTFLKLRSLLKLLLSVSFLPKSLPQLLPFSPSSSPPLAFTRAPLTTSSFSPFFWPRSSLTLWVSVWVPLSRCWLTKALIWKNYQSPFTGSCMHPEGRPQQFKSGYLRNSQVLEKFL